jgi:hypothetical protein
LLTGGLSFPDTSAAQDAADLAKELSNPVSSLISVPFQLNFDENIGPADEGSRWLLNVQPVVPFSIGEDWNLISRTIIPIIWQDDILPGESQTGFGDVVQSFFFSPKLPTAGGITWGVGPVFLLPTATDDLLGADKWAGGITGVVLRQSGGFTYGMLANHLWSFEDSMDDDGINASFVQPFLSYTTPDAWTYALNTEATYDWNSEQWSVPINGTVTKLVSVGNQRLSIGGGVRYWAESPDGGPEGWGARLLLTFLYPR